MVSNLYRRCGKVFYLLRLDFKKKGRLGYLDIGIVMKFGVRISKTPFAMDVVVNPRTSMWRDGFVADSNCARTC